MESSLFHLCLKNNLKFPLYCRTGKIFLSLRAVPTVMGWCIITDRIATADQVFFSTHHTPSAFLYGADLAN
jgi:hypothetical protein